MLKACYQFGLKTNKKNQFLLLTSDWKKPGITTLTTVCLPIQTIDLLWGGQVRARVERGTLQNGNSDLN